jgi:hypothetical protein
MGVWFLLAPITPQPLHRHSHTHTLSLSLSLSLSPNIKLLSPSTRVPLLHFIPHCLPHSLYSPTQLPGITHCCTTSTAQWKHKTNTMTTAATHCRLCKQCSHCFPGAAAADVWAAAGAQGFDPLPARQGLGAPQSLPAAPAALCAQQPSESSTLTAERCRHTQCCCC